MPRRFGFGASLRRPGIAVAVLVAGLAAFFGTPQQAVASTVPTRTVSTFELVPEAGLIRVTVVLTLTNRIPSTTTSCPGYLSCTTNYFINSGDVAVDPDGVRFRATTSGGTAGVSVKSGGEGFLSTAHLTFPGTYYGASRKVTLTYDIPGGAPRSGTFTRAGQAYATFCGFPGGAYKADPESFRLIIPGHYDVNQLSGATLTKSSADGKTIWSGPESVWSSEWHGACVEAVDEGAFATSRHSSPGGLVVDILAWPEDTDWLAAVSTSVGNALDALETAIGRRPDTDVITVREAVSEQLGGYAGDFDAKTSSARVSEDALDPRVAAHELAHAWFNDSFSPETWLNEGYAEYAARTALASIGSLSPCALDDRGVLDSVELSDWFFLPPEATEADQARVSAQYAVSCWIITEVGRRAGPDAMREIYAAAVDGEIAYIGADPPENVQSDATSWQEWLDLADERGLVPAGKTDLDWLQSLLSQTGVAGGESALDDRADLRMAYHQLLADTKPWSPPFSVRLPMANWSWNSALQAIQTAETTYGTHAASVALVSQLSSSKSVENAFEGSKSQTALDAARKLADQEHAAAAAVSAAVTAAKADRNPAEWVGLIGEDLNRDSADAVLALVGAQFKAATTEAGQVVKTAHDAAGTGGLRLGGGGVVLLGVTGTVVFVRRRSSARANALTPVADEAQGAPTEPMSEQAATLPLGTADEETSVPDRGEEAHPPPAGGGG